SDGRHADGLPLEGQAVAAGDGESEGLIPMAAQPQREWLEKDYYKVLGVPEEATDKDIRRAYRKLAKEHHPDSNPGHEDRFKEISAAYDVLSDAEKRTAYDEVRRLGPMAGGFGPGPGGPGAGQGGFTF